MEQVIKSEYGIEYSTIKIILPSVKENILVKYIVFESLQTKYKDILNNLELEFDDINPQYYPGNCYYTDRKDMYVTAGFGIVVTEACAGVATEFVV